MFVQNFWAVGTGNPPKIGNFSASQRTLLYQKCYDDSNNIELLRRSVFTTPPSFTTPQTLLGEGKCLQFPQNWCPHKVCGGSKSECGSKFTAHSKFTTRSIFGTAGSFGLELYTKPYSDTS